MPAYAANIHALPDAKPLHAARSLVVIRTEAVTEIPLRFYSFHLRFLSCVCRGLTSVAILVGDSTDATHAEARQRLEAFWLREDRFTATLDIDLQDAQGHARTFTLHPLPHPSPLNQTWFKRFPALLEARLRQLDASR